MGKETKTKQLRELREKQRQEALAKKKKEQRLILIISVSLLALILIAIGVSILVTNLTNKNGANTTTPEETTPPSPSYVSMTVKYTDDNDQEHTGDIVLELDPTFAPITVANFTKLVGEGFYNGLNFHRVIEDFMIQGGAPAYGKDVANIKGEFSQNGVNNPLKHERGVISMARTDAPNSASSQFFIVHKTSPHLDGKYAAFGHVISGMEYVDGIATMATNANDKPLKDAIIVSAKLIDKP